jgi:AraC-like DNA-binding protein
MKLVFIIFIIITTSLSFVTSIGQLFVRDRRFENFNLFVLFLCMAILQMQAGFLVSGLMIQYPSLLFPHFTTVYILGVILYFAYFLVSLHEEQLPVKKYLFFIPALTALAADISYLVIPAQDQLEKLNYMLFGHACDSCFMLKGFLAGSGVQATIYMAVLVYKLVRSRKTGRPVSLFGITMTFVVLTIITFDMLAFGYILSSVNLIYAASVMMGFLILSAFLINQRNPEFLQIIIIEAAKKRYARSRLARVETGIIQERLLELVEKEKIYSDENVTLTDLADELSVTPHQLSEFLNERMNCNFYTFINRFRVQEASKLLVEEPERTILSIAHIVGFNSKSSFYEAFSRFIGMTPSQYRTKYIKINSRN